MKNFRLPLYAGVILLMILSACNRPQTVQSSGKYDDIITESRRLMDSLLQTGKTPGIDIAVSLHGEVTWSEAFGFADLEHQVPMKAGETRCRIGSVSKPVSAAAIGILMDQGRIDINLPVQTYVPYFPEKEYPLTVKQVAGHIGGIRHYKDLEFMMAKRFETVEEGIAIFKDDPLLFKPGERFSYSSYAFNLLSAAVEGASGESFLDFMQREVFDKLGMDHTTADVNDSIIVDRASFYELNNRNEFVNAAYVDNSYKWAGGGFISTTLDLLKFGEAHMKPGYLTAETLTELTTPQKLNDGSMTEYGIGWFIGEYKGHRRISHGGGSIGGITDFVVYPEKELVLAVVTNSSDARFGNVLDRILDMYLEIE